MWYYKKRLICTEGALRLPTTHDKHRIEGIHQMSIGILGGVLALGLVLIVVYVLVKTGLVSSCDSNATNKSTEEKMSREEQNNHHRVNMLPLNHVVALMNETREENLALRVQIRGSRSDFEPSAPEDRSNKFPVM